jgi:phosphatidylglycerol:prolipoprotein diacylglycerol transferase
MIELGVSPIAFTLGPVEVRWYGIFVALAVLTVVLWVLWEARRGTRLSYDTVFTAALVGIPSGVVFSRLLHVVDDLVQHGSQSQFFQDPSRIIGSEGLTAWGAILGAALGIWLYSRARRMHFGYIADMVAPGVILAQAVGRIGCTLNGCCYGVSTSLPWGIVYTNPESLGFPASLNLAAGMGLHPTQVYEIIWNLAVFVVLFKLRGRLKPEGSLFLLYLSLYSVWRVGGDFLREGSVFLFGLHQAQFVGIIVLAIAVPMLVLRTRWARPEATEPDEPVEPVEIDED